MNRPIKFRAWIKDEEKMIYPNERNYYVRNGGGLFRIVRLSDKKGQSFISIEVDSVLMQFTGLFDKNGKEIYFDDIVELDGCRAIVDFEPAICALSLTPIDENNWCEDWQADDLHRFEVIGNKFQTPDLLTPTGMKL